MEFAHIYLIYDSKIADTDVNTNYANTHEDTQVRIDTCTFSYIHTFPNHTQTRLKCVSLNSRWRIQREIAKHVGLILVIRLTNKRVN